MCEFYGYDKNTYNIYTYPKKQNKSLDINANLENINNDKEDV